MNNQKLTYEELQKKVDELEKRERYYNQIIQNTTEAIMITQDGKVIFANQKTLEITGYNLAEMKAQPFLVVVHPDDKEMVLNNYTNRLQGKESSSSYSFRILKKTGEILWLNISVLIILWKGKIATLNYITDISKEKAREEKIAYQNSLLEMTHNPIVSLDLEANILTWNKAAENFYGWKEEEVIGKNYNEIMNLQYPNEAIEQVKQALYVGGLWRGEIIQTTKNGTKLHMLGTGIIIKDQDGKSTGVLSTTTDITERRKIEIKAEENIKNIEFLSAMAMEFLMLPEDQDICDIIGNKLSSLIPDAYFTLTPFESGLRAIKIKTYSKLLHNGFKEDKYDIFRERSVNLQLNIPTNFLSGQLVESPNLYEAAWRTLSLEEATAKQTALAINKIYKIAFVNEGEILGMISIFLTGKDIENKNLIEAFVRQSSIAIQSMNSRVALQKSEQRFRELAELLPEIVYESDILGNLTFLNKSGFEKFGLTADELKTGINFKQFLVPKTQSVAINNFNRSISDRVFVKGQEYYAYNKNSEPFPFLVYSSPIMQDGKTLGLRGVLVDISERKEAEKALMQSEEKFSKAFRSSPQLIVLSDIETTQIIEVNDAVKDIVGYEREEVLGKTILELGVITQIEKDQVSEIYSKHGSIRDFEVPFKTKSKETRIGLFSAETIEINGQMCLLHTLRDITDTRKAENALKDSETNYRNLVEFSPNGIIIHDESSVYYANKIALELLGCTTNKKLSIDLLLAGNNKTLLKKTLGDSDEEIPFIEIEICRLRDKQTINLEAKSSQFTYNGKKVYQTIIRDISTQKKLLQGQIRAQLAEESNQKLKKEMSDRKRTEKVLKKSLQEKEVLLKEVHHRVKNNMQIISSILNLQSHKIDDPSIKSFFVESQDRIKSMALIHENLYRTDDFANVNFSSYVRTLVDNLLRTYAVNPAVIEMHLDIDKIFFSLDTGISCGLIINELVSNSIKYAFENREKGSIFVVIKREADNQISMIIQDDGVGIKKNININDTKSLGLQIVNALVDQIDGVIEIETKKGTKFTITFKL